MYNPQIKEKHALVDLSTFGTESRKSIRPNVLIGVTPQNPMFVEGDILDGNAILNLILGAYNEGKVFEVFSKEGLKIASRLDDIEKSTLDNYDNVNQEINSLNDLHSYDIARLNDIISTIEKNIVDLKRVVDITLLSEENKKKSYVVEKQDGSKDTIVISDGEKGDKGDSFKFEDFTELLLESLKVKGDKGDKGTSIISATLVQTSYSDGGINIFRVLLDDGTISDMQVRNGRGEDIANDLAEKSLTVTYEEADESLIFATGISI